MGSGGGWAWVEGPRAEGKRGGCRWCVWGVGAEGLAGVSPEAGSRLV